jgi:hypothetical protein
MAITCPSDEDDLQYDSDAGASQMSGSTPKGSNVEMDEPQAEDMGHYTCSRWERALQVISSTDTDCNTETASPQQSRKSTNVVGKPKSSSKLAHAHHGSAGEIFGQPNPPPAAHGQKEGTTSGRPGRGATNSQAKPSPTACAQKEGKINGPPGVTIGQTKPSPAACSQREGTTNGRPGATNSQTNRQAASNNSDNMIDHSSLTWPGTLLYLATDSNAENTATTKHIVHWMDILHQGGDAFGNAVARNGRRLTQ